jgi:hypothetical protein
MIDSEIDWTEKYELFQLQSIADSQWFQFKKILKNPTDELMHEYFVRTPRGQ